MSEKEVIKHVGDLRPGDLIKNRHNGEVYLVAHNYGSEAIIVLTKRVREGDGHNWRMHHRPEPESNQLMIPAPAAWQGDEEDIYECCDACGAADVPLYWQNNRRRNLCKDCV